MPKYIIVRETGSGWDYFQSGREFYNTVEAALDAARRIASDGFTDCIAVAEVVKRLKSEVSVKEVPVK